MGGVIQRLEGGKQDSDGRGARRAGCGRGAAHLQHVGLEARADGAKRQLGPRLLLCVRVGLAQLIVQRDGAHGERGRLLAPEQPPQHRGEHRRRAERGAALRQRLVHAERVLRPPRVEEQLRHGGQVVVEEAM